ncbi:hypothetical protein J4H56_12990 [Vibrio alginolyticus]|uniref:hypothetical protein n=1 Tax=Vibrio TaxID=662 RepID=UPI0006CF5396|nr:MULTISPECIES: hypothetical protein [Vibrio]EGR0801938.1 hypothetical protein [Vibrio alginolyticus]EJS2612237.1 hypothetical protein [Vibrio alginolyticus]ELA6600274.1 hypothetical protein [Vibrio alginolyticus]ELB2280007.1 hypothetical protein [Vibrio alginolyticus]ELN6883373.1 hypothetical protein [Vibrio alginolyticus]
MNYNKFLLVLCMLIPHFNVNAKDVGLQELTPLSNLSLEEYRGGFQITDEYIINIGLSITTTINGDDILNTNIANLVIENGNLKNISANSENQSGDVFNQGIVNIIQFGEGNIIGDNSIDSPKMPSSQNPNIISSDFINSSIINIIQNTKDNSIIGLSTLVDIDAQVNGVIREIKANQQLEDALLNHLQ